VGGVQFPTAATADAEVRRVAVVGSVRAPAVNVVEVPWMFQPVVLLVRSLGLRTLLVVFDWSAPSRVIAGKPREAGVARLREPPVQVTGLKARRRRGRIARK
jgi:hypothetical protein